MSWSCSMILLLPCRFGKPRVSLGKQFTNGGFSTCRFTAGYRPGTGLKEIMQREAAPAVCGAQRSLLYRLAIPCTSCMEHVVPHIWVILLVHAGQYSMHGHYRALGMCGQFSGWLSRLGGWLACYCLDMGSLAEKLLAASRGCGKLVILRFLILASIFTGAKPTSTIFHCFHP